MIYPSLSVCCLCHHLHFLGPQLRMAQVTGVDVTDTVSLGPLGANGARMAQDLTVEDQELMLVNQITGPQHRYCLQ